MRMKRTVIFFLLAVWALLVISCSHPRLVVRGFVDEPQDSILIDLSKYVKPGSGVELANVRKCDGYYYFQFFEVQPASGIRSILMAASESRLKARHIPLPDDVNGISDIFERNDTLFIDSTDGQSYSFNPKKWKWSPASSDKGYDMTLYEDADWKVNFARGGDFGNVSWFIDKHSQEEYAFVKLNGGIRRTSSAFYVVTPTRVYEIPDPFVGFRCDSATRYENAKDVVELESLFSEAGYTPPSKYFINPVIRFDNENLSGEYLLDGKRIYFNPYYVFGEIEAHGRILTSFCASDTLFCVLHTEPGWELAKLEDGNLVPVHHFNKDIGYCHPVIFPYEFPSLTTRYKYRDKSNPADERMLLQVNTEKGVSELIDLTHNGNTVLKVRYFPAD